MLGVLPTMVDCTSVSKKALAELHEKYGDVLFNTQISKSVEAAKSSESSTPLYMTGHKLGQEYDELAQEVLSSGENTEPKQKHKSVKISGDTYTKYFSNGEKALEMYFANQA